MGSAPEVIETPIIFFDGVCNLCNGAVNFIIDRDKKKKFLFASLQSDRASQILKNTSLDTSQLDTIVLKEEDELFTKSTAVLKIAKRLGSGWSIFYGFIIIPRPIRDFIYDVVSNYRYNWFGKRETCRLPTPELKERFLDSYDVS